VAGPVKYNNAFFEQLGRSPEVVELTTDVAQEIADTAIADGPRDTEDYVNGIKVQVKFQKRVVALVVGTDKKTMLIESKTGNLVRALNKKKRSRG
jgi:hypothetical protein